jgi:hypothetical protein
MCNLYSITMGQAAILAFTRPIRDMTVNLPALPDGKLAIVARGEQ